MTTQSNSGRHGARRLLLQALYQLQIGGHDPDELKSQFTAKPEYSTADHEYFDAVLDDVLSRTAELDDLLDEYLDRPISQLDPVERALLWIGAAELSSRPDVPRATVINEAVELAKTFGGQDSFRYVNAVLDKAAQALRG